LIRIIVFKLDQNRRGNLNHNDTTNEGPSQIPLYFNYPWQNDAIEKSPHESTKICQFCEITKRVVLLFHLFPIAI
jgi:hypothetical protein